MSRCQTCGTPLVCSCCQGAKGGRRNTEAQAAARAANRAKRWQWRPGQLVRAKQGPRWEGVILDVGAPNQEGEHLLTLRITHNPCAADVGLSVPYETTLADFYVVRLPAGQKASR